MEYRNGILSDSVMPDRFVNVYDCTKLPKPTASLPLLLAEYNRFTVSFPNSILSFEYFLVFNRNGQLMFVTGKPGERWGETTDGHPAPAGTYVREAAGIKANKKFMIKSGIVILIR